MAGAIEGKACYLVLSKRRGRRESAAWNGLNVVVSDVFAVMFEQRRRVVGDKDAREESGREVRRNGQTEQQHFVN